MVLRVCSIENYIRQISTNQLHFLPLSLKFGAWYMTGQWDELRIKNATLCFHIFFWHFFVAFHHKSYVFIIFISFLDEVLNFRNRILINQKYDRWSQLSVNQYALNNEHQYRNAYGNLYTILTSKDWVKWLREGRYQKQTKSMHKITLCFSVVLTFILRP